MFVCNIHDDSVESGNEVIILIKLLVLPTRHVEMAFLITDLNLTTYF